MKPYTIYALVDRETQEIKYIGKTHRKPSERMREHLQPAKMKKRTPKNKWLRSIIAKGQTPLMLVLFTNVLTPMWSSSKAERKVIAYFDLFYDNLTNSFRGY